MATSKASIEDAVTADHPTRPCFERSAPVTIDIYGMVCSFGTTNPLDDSAFSARDKAHGRGDFVGCFSRVGFVGPGPRSEFVGPGAGCGVGTEGALRERRSIRAQMRAS